MEWKLWCWNNVCMVTIHVEVLTYFSPINLRWNKESSHFGMQSSIKRWWHTNCCTLAWALKREKIMFNAIFDFTVYGTIQRDTRPHSQRDVISDVTIDSSPTNEGKTPVLYHTIHQCICCPGIHHDRIFSPPTFGRNDPCWTWKITASRGRYKRVATA